MQKEKESSFSEKFKLLNSQENTENILWTSSESSELDNASNCERLCSFPSRAQKRKRIRKKKVPKNISNLVVSIVDVSKDVTEDSTSVKFSKSLQKCVSRIEKTSPTCEHGVSFPPYKYIKHEGNSPILSSKAGDQQKRRCLPDQSPILKSKYASPKNSPKIRKKLFKTGIQEIKGHNEYIESCNRSCSPILLPKNYGVQELQRWKSENLVTNSFKYSTTQAKSIHTNHRASQQDTIIKSGEINQNIIKKKTSIVITETPTNDSSKSEELNLDDSLIMLKTSNHELVKRVKSYFDSNFSSETTSQCSITESLTPKHSSKTSEEIEILNFVTQMNSVINISSTVDGKSKNPSLESSQSSDYNENSKKIRYKKGGLAYRLNSLVKKRMANISLWQHEKFMVENSDFVIPKGEHVVFQIQKVDFKYGCYLIQVVDLSEDIFLILINNKYVHNSNIAADMILKLYDPYKTIDFKDECKLIINVCKFECVSRS